MKHTLSLSLPLLCLLGCLPASEMTQAPTGEVRQSRPAPVPAPEVSKPAEQPVVKIVQPPAQLQQAPVLADLDFIELAVKQEGKIPRLAKEKGTIAVISYQVKSVRGPNKLLVRALWTGQFSGRWTKDFILEGLPTDDLADGTALPQIVGRHVIVSGVDRSRGTSLYIITLQD